MSIEKLKKMIDFAEKTNSSLLRMPVKDAKNIVKEYEAECNKPAQETNLDNVIISGGKF